MTSPTGDQRFLSLLQLGMAARQSLRLRMALLHAEARERGQFAGQGLVFVIIALVLAIAALGLGIAAVVAMLVAAGWSLQAALGLTAGGTAVLALICLFFGRRAFRNATASRP